MELQTKRLLLRPWEDGDAEILYRWAKDPEVGPMAGWKPHESAAESLAIIHGPLGMPETYALVLRETGEPVGSAGLFPPEFAAPTEFPPEAVQLELGYWIARPYWGQGLVPEAAEELLRYAFEELDCRMAHCSHFEWNGQSRRVIEKLGFAPAGVHDTVDSLGRTQKMLCYTMPRAVWARRRQA